MEKVTVYGSVHPGRGERLPRVDFTESTRSNSPPPLEALPLYREIPAPRQTRQCSTRLLPNLRYLPPYDEGRPDKNNPAEDDDICPSNRQSFQASVYEDLASQQEKVQSRRSLAFQHGRSENPLGSTTIRRKSSREQSAAEPLTSTSIALRKELAASSAISHSYNTMSTAMKHRSKQLLQKPTLATLPRPKHKKTLAGGRQIKTHLRCEHLLSGPVWGGGAPSAQLEQRSDDGLTKREVFERHRIARKIDALCAASARRGPGMGDQRRVDVRKGKRGRELEVEEEGSLPSAKHNKLMASGRQYKTLLNCHHPPDQRRAPARPVTTVAGEGHDEGDRKFSNRQERLGSPDVGTSDDEGHERQSSYPKTGCMGSNRNKLVLKSNTKTPRRSYSNIGLEAGSHLTALEAQTRSDATSSYGEANEDSYSLNLRGNTLKKCDCLHRRSPRYKSSDCVYCREDASHSLRSQCKLCPDVTCSHISHDDVSSAPPSDHHPITINETCPVFNRESTSKRDGGRFGRRYQTSCPFCGMVFGRSNLPVVSDDEDTLYGSCDHHYRSSRPDRRHHCDRPQHPGRTEEGGHLATATAGRKRTARGVGFQDVHPRTSHGSEKTSNRDRDERSSVPDGDKRSHSPPMRSRTAGRLPPLARPFSLRHGPGRMSSTVQFSDYSDDDTNDTATTSARFAACHAVDRDKRTYHGNPTSYDATDSCGGPSQRRFSMGTGILKNSEKTSRFTYSDNLLQNNDVNARSSTVRCDQRKNDSRQRGDVGAREGNSLSVARSRVNEQNRGVRPMSRKENIRPSLPRGTEEVIRVRRDPTHSLVLEDHL